MLARWVRSWDGVVLRPLIHLLAVWRITPTMVTVASLATVLAAAGLVANGCPVSAALTLLVGGFLDGVDGELARSCGRQSAFGAFLDSICDHLGDFAVNLALLHWCLQQGLVSAAVLVFAAQFGSLFGSQVRSRAGMLGIETGEVGLFTRFERILVLVLGLLTGKVTVALWVLALCSNLSALQRAVYVVRRARPG